MSEMRRVTAIRNGTVVDHIPSGYAMQVIRILRINADRATPVSLVMNVPSDKLGRKDVLKIEAKRRHGGYGTRMTLSWERFSPRGFWFKGKPHRKLAELKECASALRF